MSWFEALRYGHFSPETDAALRDPHGTVMDERLMVLLDQARQEAGVPFIVTSGARPPAVNRAAGGATDSAHLITDDGHKAYAVDGHFVGWPLLKQLLHIMRFPFFGIGVYPHPLPSADRGRPWTPVVHVDRKDRGKPYNAQVLWIRNAAGAYVYWPSAEFWAEFRALAREVA